MKTLQSKGQDLSTWELIAGPSCYAATVPRQSPAIYDLNVNHNGLL